MTHSNKPLSIACTLLLSLLTATNANADKPTYTEANVILTKYCAGCHNTDDANGEFALDTFGGLVKGGEHGNAITPGSAASSRMVQMMRGKLEPKMPPEDEPSPSDVEFQLIIDWIESGAVGPQKGTEGESAWTARLNTPKLESKVDFQPITALAFSSDHQKLAVARFGKIELRDNNGTNVLKTLADLPGKVTSVAFLKNDEFLIAGTGIAGLYGEAIMIQLSDGKVVRRFRGHRDLVYSVAISADERWLATGGYDRKSVLWRVSSDNPVREFLGHNDAVFENAFDLTGERLVTASADATVKVWRVADAERLDTRGEPLKEQNTVAISPDGHWIVAGGEDNRIRKWKLVSQDAHQTNPLVIARFAHESAIQLLRFHGTGDYLISVANEGAIKIWETESLTEVYRFKNSSESVQAIAVAEDRLVVGRMDGTLDVLNWPTEALENRIEVVGNTGGELVRPSNVMETNTKSLEELEPNDEVDEAMMVEAPFIMAGSIHADQGTDVDTFQFHAAKGQRWIIEAKADKNKTLDTHISVMDSKGRPVPRVLLRSVRDSYFTFRGKNSKQASDFRVHNWEEMKLNQLLYCNGEVVRLFHYPRGPDSGFNVYPNFGNRHSMFDTTPIAHALHELCFIVDAHPPGTDFPANGLPQFLLNYENDDDAQQEMGTNSRLTFVAPAAGDYLVRVRDSRDFGDEKFTYKLSVRLENPDFAISGVQVAKPTLLRGTYKQVGVTIDRIDNFTGPIDIEIAGLPPGVQATGPITVEKNGLRAFFTLHANDDASAPEKGEAEPVVNATAMINGRLVTRSKKLGVIKIADSPKLLVRLKHAPKTMPHFDQSGLPVLEIHPGETITAQVVVARMGHESRISFGKEDAALNLPFGVYVDNTGLNGVLIPPGETKRTIFLTAEKWVEPCSRLIFLEAQEAGKPSSNPAVLRVLPVLDGRMKESESITASD